VKSRAPFIHRELRPEMGANDPPPPLLGISTPPSDLARQARKVLSEENVTDRLDLDDPGAGGLPHRRTFAPDPQVISAHIDGETVLLNLRTASSYTLNRVGAVIWDHLSAGRSVRAGSNAVCRQFEVPAEVAAADANGLVRELCREGLLRAQPATACSARAKASTNNRGNRAHRKGPAAGKVSFAVKAIALERKGRGILVANADNWEKSPHCLALLRAGCRLLATDGVCWCDKRIHLPRLSDGRARKPVPARLLLFPQAVDWPESSLEPMSRGRALEELLWLTYVKKGRKMAPADFHMLGRLVEMTVSYRLHCGERHSRLAALLDALLENQTETIKT